MLIDELEQLVPPPVAPVDSVGKWGDVYRVLGVELPDDYVALVQQYGSGLFCNLTLFTPFTEFRSANLVAQAQTMIEIHQPLYARSCSDFGYPLFPDVGGLLPWGCSDGGSDLCWLTEGEPNAWPVVVWNIDANYHYGPSSIGFLIDYLSGRSNIPQLGPVCEKPWFEPSRERVEVLVDMGHSPVSFELSNRELRDFLRPTEDRLVELREVDQQVRFKAIAHDWLITHYEGPSEHWVLAYVPPEDAAPAASTLREAAAVMGCDVMSA